MVENSLCRILPSPLEHCATKVKDIKRWYREILPEMLHFTPLKSLQVRANPPPSAGVCCLDAAQVF